METMIQMLFVFCLCPILGFSQVSENPCTVADLGFLMDSSRTISKTNFQREKQVIEGLVNLYHVKPFGSRAGLLTFSTKPSLKAGIGEIETPEKLKELVRGIKPVRGSTYINLAIEEATRNLFGVRYVEPKRQEKILFILTDGMQTGRINLKIFTRSLRRLRVRIIAIAIGDNTDRRHLLELVAAPKDILYVKSRDNIKDKIAAIHSHTCLKPPGYCEAKVNLGFVLDASRTTSHKFKAQKDLVSLITESFVPTPGGTQFCLSKFSDEGSLEIPFTHDNYDFTTELDFVTSVKGRTYIEKGLRAIEKEFDKNAIPGRPKILLVLTDGRQTRNSYLVKKAADDLRKKGVVIYAITTNEPYRMKVLKDIAGSNGSVMHLKLVKHLKNKIAQRVVKTVCPHGRTE